MHVNSALQLNCHSRVLSQSGAERSESMIEAEKKQRQQQKQKQDRLSLLITTE